ncbi:hypothetical protein [Streptococcus ruminantium]|uniref:hypothetical protein n=1 Tax=Streptococcus ruminantium TaxID=1917441 RepID=UPI0012DD222B|nr:hypothetical protein [Streptococcus ruminantium]
MQLSDTLLLARTISEALRRVFSDRIDGISVYDIVEAPNHRAFKIKFCAYNYFILVFNYERDIIGISIDTGSQPIRLSKVKKTYSGGGLEEYLEEIKQEIELRIPDKFLKANGWL